MIALQTSSKFSINDSLKSKKYSLNWLQLKKSEGMRLGRPKGSLNKEVKLTGKEEDIKKLLDKKVAVAAIARILDVNRLTVRSFIKTRKIG